MGSLEVYERDSLHDKHVELSRSHWEDNLLHVHSSCCGCDYNFNREQAEQLRDYLTKLLEDKE